MPPSVEDKTIERLREERDQLREILDSLPDAVIVLDGERKLLWCNSRCKEFTGLDPDRLINGGRFYDPFYSESEDGEGKLTAMLREKGEPIQYIHIESEGDEQQYYRVILTPFLDREGNLSRVVETIRPITDIVLQRRKIDQSERLFRQFVDHARDLITIKDRHGVYLVINQQAASLFGGVPEDYLGKTDREVFSEELAELLSRPDREVIKRKGHLSQKRKLLIQGETRYLDMVHFPFYDYKGDVAGVCSISRDVSEQTQLQHMLIQSEKMAAVGKLAASVAHEINNPLTGVLSFAEELKMDALEKDPNDPILQDYEVIIHEALRCRGIVSQLLDYARFEPTQAVSINMNALIERSVALVRKQAAFQDIRFEYDLTDNLGEMRIVPSQMQQVFMNLIVNAADAVDHSGRITLSSRLSGDGQFVEASVSDDGPGVPPEIMDSIFEPFFSTKGPRGTGQGLSVVKAIVEQHGGTIRVHNNPDDGAVFTISLPRLQWGGQERWA